jgi:hypothetical protein
VTIISNLKYIITTAFTFSQSLEKFSEENVIEVVVVIQFSSIIIYLLANLKAQRPIRELAREWNNNKQP